MLRSLIPLSCALVFLVSGSALAQEKGQVSGVRKVPAQGVRSVSGEPVRTAEVEPAVESDALALLLGLGEAFLAEDVEAITGTMIKTDIRFSLDPDGQPAEMVEAPLQSREQIHYLLSDYFDEVEVEGVECDCPEEDLGVEDAHGVLEIWLQDSTRSRLFVRLRQLSEGWRVTELRALP